MAFTRFHDDPCRIEKQLQESSGPGKYTLNVPGNGSSPHFMEDPFIRLQRWGANLHTNTINLSSDLKGLTRNLSRDCFALNDYKLHSVESTKLNYPNLEPITEQPRAIHPAWTARDLEQDNRGFLSTNPQDHATIPFTTNFSTRISEKDNHVTKYPCVNNDF